MLRQQAWCCFLAGIALASDASAQIEVDWWRAYDLPESYDGDSVTHSVALSASGAVFTAVRTYYFAYPATRFLRYSPAGALTSSVLGPAGLVFSRSLLAPSGDVYFAGWGGPAQGYRLVKLATNGALLWTQTIVAAPDQRVELLFDANGDVALVGADQNTGLTIVRGFTSAGAVAYSHDFDLGPSSESVHEAVLGGNGEIVVAGSADTRAVVAALDISSGQILWSVFNAGALGLGAKYVALAQGANGEIAVAGNSTLAGSSDVWVTTLDSSGAVLGSAAIDAGAGNVETVTDIEYSSDGALWVSGHTYSSGQTVSFFLRFPKGASVPAQLLWNSDPNLIWSQAKHLLAGGPGQMWAIAEFLELGAPFQVGALQLDFDGSLNLALGASFDENGAEKQLECAARGPGQTLAVGGRSEDTPGGLGFFDPVSMVSKFDFSDAPREYCQAQTNSAGCVPVLSCAGRASLTSTQAFRIRVGDVISGAAGLYFYGANGASSVPFLGGLKCVASPVLRSSLLIAGTGGSGPCPSEFSIDWNAFARGQLGGNPAPELTVPGTAIYLQCWSRDGAAAFGTNLSSALRYVVLP
jgi:hypothetical protein